MKGGAVGEAEVGLALDGGGRAQGESALRLLLHPVDDPLQVLETHRLVDPFHHVVVRTNLIALLAQVVALALQAVEAGTHDWRYLAAIAKEGLVD